MLLAVVSLKTEGKSRLKNAKRIETEEGSFVKQRTKHFRPPPIWHPLRYIHVRLPEAVEHAVAGFNLHSDAKVLDFGCAEKRYRRFFPIDCDYKGADLPGNEEADVEILSDGRLPLADSSMDFVLSTQVLEHVNDPELYLEEAYRVLRPGGALVLSTHGIMFYHPDPVDYWRWTGAGLKKIIAKAGFEIAEFEGIMGLASSAIQLFLTATLHRVPSVLRKPYALFFQFLVAFFDRRTSRGMRRANALVYIVSARKQATAE